MVVFQFQTLDPNQICLGGGLCSLVVYKVDFYSQCGMNADFVQVEQLHFMSLVFHLIPFVILCNMLCATCFARLSYCFIMNGVFVLSCIMYV